MRQIYLDNCKHFNMENFEICYNKVFLMFKQKET